MKTGVVMALALATGVVAGAANAELGQPTDQALKEKIKALWQDQHQALDAHDIAGVMATFADTDDIMLMGTGPGEHWVGKQEVKDAYAHLMENFDPNTMEVKCGEAAGTSQGSVVWLTGVCNFTDKKGDESRHYVLNISAVLAEQGDAWRFHSMHYSHLVCGDGEQTPGASE